MRNLATTLILIFALTVFAKGQQPEKPTLNIVGSAEVTVKPDLCVLEISVSELQIKMSDAIIALGEKSNYYKDFFKKLGFNEKDLKTTSFKVTQNFIWREGKYIDSGFKASQNISLEFVYNQDILQNIVVEFSKSEQSIGISFGFELSDELKQKVQSQIIEYAVKDAYDRAAVMAKAAKVTLVRLQKISYGSSGRFGGMQLTDRRHRYYADLAMEASDGIERQSFNFTPDDLIYSDNVTLEWIIK